MRLFFAITLPDAIRDALAQETAELRAEIRSITWVAPQLLHITMKFLGECDETALDGIQRVARSVATSAQPISLSLGGGGAFPNFLAPRVVWIGMHNAAPLITLAAKLERSLEPLGFAAEARPFRAHITLGRVKSALSRTDASRLEHGLRALHGVWPLRVSLLSLIQSELGRGDGRGGPRYTTRAEFPLGGA